MKEGRRELRREERGKKALTGLVWGQEIEFYFKHLL